MLYIEYSYYFYYSNVVFGLFFRFPKIWLISSDWILLFAYLLFLTIINYLLITMMHIIVINLR